MNIFTRGALMGVMCAFGVMVMEACKKPTDDINIMVNTASLSKAPTLVQFVNANPNSKTVFPSSFKATITGPGAGLVQVDGGGNNFTVTDGILPLSLTKDANPSLNNPVTYNIYVEVPGFVPVATTITTTNTNISMPVIPLVEYASPASGTAAVVKQNNISAGTTPAAVVLATTTNATTTEASSVRLAGGTQLLDESGKVINSTTLKSNIVYFGTGNTQSLNAFPGGFDAQGAIDAEGKKLPQGTNFVTAGLLSINMAAGNTSVKGFSKPVDLTMELNSELVNPQTKRTVKAGDLIPIWSMNEQTGNWKYESTATVVTGSNGKLVVNFPITHLSSWAANWTSNTCGSDLTVNVRADQETSGDYVISLVTANEQPVSSVTTNKLYNGYTTIMNNIPSDAGNMKLIAYSRDGNALTKIGETMTFDPCSAGSVTITLANRSVGEYVKTNVKVTAKCTNKQVIAYPSAWITLKNTTTGENTNLYMSDGIATANLANGSSYAISTNYAGRSYTSEAFKLDKAAGVTIPSMKGLTGTTSYDAASNTITVDATFTLSSCN
ncbi:hypothetical protein LLH06_20635 [Mucilaginibacter daejeonensis]|uniref:hypothetical protein n=1 Tax=Mucilaginibacter daejeonensis TaxID=398049 RepID=UPI001D17A130|nr:hypothetical protein [Mucilaginibacter daejeonensis]UEG53346.1 hypothetical protein LLH06_20635 [Mucilaginibacter daejeonensis]